MLPTSTLMNFGFTNIPFCSYVRNKTFNCRVKHRFGNHFDGGYELCLDPPFTPIQNDCLVWSFGLKKNQTEFKYKT